MASPEKSLGKKSTKAKGSKKSKATKHKPRHTHIEHGEDGSHVIRHSFDQDEDGGGPPDSVHGVSDANGLLAHMQDQFGGQLPDQSAAGGGSPDAAAAGPGAAAAPLPQAGM